MVSNEPFLPIIDPNRCEGCGDCVQVCPRDVLRLVNGLAALAYPERCNYCGDCEEHCPTEAISLPYEIVDDSLPPPIETRSNLPYDSKAR